MDRRFGVQQIEQAFGRTGGAHHVAPDFRHRADPARDQRRVEHKGSELADGEQAIIDLTGADPENEDDGAHHRRDDQRGERRPHTGTLDGGDEAGFGALGETSGLGGFLRVGLNGRHGVEDFAGQRRGVGDFVLRFARQFFDLAADGDDRQDQQSHQAEVEGEEIKAGDGQHHHAADKLKEAAQSHRNRAADHGLDQRRVAGQAR